MEGAVDKEGRGEMGTTYLLIDANYLINMLFCSPTTAVWPNGTLYIRMFTL